MSCFVVFVVFLCTKTHFHIRISLQMWVFAFAREIVYLDGNGQAFKVVYRCKSVDGVYLISPEISLS